MTKDSVAPRWRKSKISEFQNACVEVATDARKVLMRDSKDPHGAVLALELDVFRAFIADVEAGRFDLPKDV